MDETVSVQAALTKLVDDLALQREKEFPAIVRLTSCVRALSSTL